MAIFFILIFVIVVFILGLWIFPIETKSLCSLPQPSSDYTESIQHIEQIMSTEKPPVADYGRSILLTHGKKVKRVVVCYHGYTNCPRQYEQLAKRFFDKGYNVYVPRVPHCGIDDRFTKEVARLTIDEIREVCDTSVDIARGLGEKITVLGLSLGGVMAAWNAQFRNDIDQAFVLVPSFGWYYLPGVVKPLINLSFLFPNMFLWWDPIQKEKRECPYSMYHHFCSHGIGHIMRLGLSVLKASQKQAPGAKRIIVMTNDLDNAVDELNVRRLVERWERFGTSVSWYRFAKDLKMEHDIIDPLHPYARVDFVYDKILEYFS